MPKHPTPEAQARYWHARGGSWQMVVGEPTVCGPQDAVLRAAQRLDPRELQVDSGRKVSLGCSAPPRAPSQGCTKIPAWETKECILHHLFEGAEFHSTTEKPNLDPSQRRWVRSLPPSPSLPLCLKHFSVGH